MCHVDNPGNNIQIKKCQLRSSPAPQRVSPKYQFICLRKINYLSKLFKIPSPTCKKSTARAVQLNLSLLPSLRYCLVKIR